MMRAVALAALAGTAAAYAPIMALDSYDAVLSACPPREACCITERNVACRGRRQIVQAGTAAAAAAPLLRTEAAFADKAPMNAKAPVRCEIERTSLQCNIVSELNIQYPVVCLEKKPEAAEAYRARSINQFTVRYVHTVHHNFRPPRLHSLRGWLPGEHVCSTAILNVHTRTQWSLL